MTVFGIFQSNGHRIPLQAEQAPTDTFQSIDHLKFWRIIIYHLFVLFWSRASSDRNSIFKSILILSSMFNKISSTSQLTCSIYQKEQTAVWHLSWLYSVRGYHSFYSLSLTIPNNSNQFIPPPLSLSPDTNLIQYFLLLFRP